MRGGGGREKGQREGKVSKGAGSQGKGERGKEKGGKEQSSKNSQGKEQTYLPINKPQPKTLRITIPRAILRARLIQPSSAPTHQHLTKIKRPIHATRQVAHIRIERDLFPQQFKHLIILPVLRNQIRPWRNRLIPPLASSVRHPLPQRQLIARRLNPHSGIINPLEGAVSRAGLGVGTQSVADDAGDGQVVGFVQRPLEGVEDYGGLDCFAPVREGAVLCGEFGVVFGDEGSDLLGGGYL